MSFLPSKADNYTLINLLLEYADFTRPLVEFTESVMRGPSPFSELQRETIFAFLSGLNGCRFCQMSHTVAIEALGGSSGCIQDLLIGQYPDDMAEEMRPVLDYARKMNSELEEISQIDINAVLKAGWDEVAVVHIAYICGLANLYNRIVSGLGIPPDEEIMKRGGMMIANDGYLGINAMLKAS